MTYVGNWFLLGLSISHTLQVTPCRFTLLVGFNAPEFNHAPSDAGDTADMVCVCSMVVVGNSDYVPFDDGISSILPDVAVELFFAASLAINLHEKGVFPGA